MESIQWTDEISRNWKQAEYYFGSQVQQLDLSNQSYASANQINSWVSRQTNGKINNILFSLPPGTRLVAANAIYLKADWAVPFDQDSTREAPFYVTADETISVQTMMQQNDVWYVENPHLRCKMVALPYKVTGSGRFQNEKYLIEIFWLKSSDWNLVIGPYRGMRWSCT